MYPRFQGTEQAPRKAPYDGVSVRSVLSLNLTSQHHNQRVICQAYSPLLAEGANTFFKLHVLCKCELFVRPPSFVCFLYFPLRPRDIVCITLKRCSRMICDGTSVSRFAHRLCMCVVVVVSSFLLENLCCDLWVCRALQKCVLIVHLLCCTAMFVFDAISQAAASRCLKAPYCVRA